MAATFLCDLQCRSVLIARCILEFTSSLSDIPYMQHMLTVVDHDNQLIMGHRLFVFSCGLVTVM